MYIKFCRSYGEDKKDEAGENLSPESKLSVELEEGKGRPEPRWLFVFVLIKISLLNQSSSSDKQTDGNTRLYRAACLFLTILCLLLLVVVTILGVKREYLQPWIMSGL